jgi:hypothetical protein
MPSLTLNGFGCRMVDNKYSRIGNDAAVKFSNCFLLFSEV